MEYTTNLNLKKPAYSDPADIADLNGNMDILDGVVSELMEDVVHVSNIGFTWHDGEYIQKSNGKPIEYAPYSYAEINLENVKHISFKLISDSSNASFGTVDKNNTVITFGYNHIPVTEWIEYDVEEDDYQLRVSCNTGQKSEFICIADYGVNKLACLTEKVNFTEFDWRQGNLSDTGTESQSSSTTYIRFKSFYKVKHDNPYVVVPDEMIANLYVYNSDGSFSRYAKKNTGEKHLQIDEGELIKFTLHKSDGSDLTYDRGKLMYMYYINDTKETIIDNRIALNNVSRYISLSMFEDIGVVGDSFSAGVIYSDSTNVTKNNKSWGKILGRNIGADVSIYAAGGMTTQGWLSNSHCLPLMESEQAKELYYVCLGINDYNAISRGQMTLGDISDIDVNDYTNNGETFFGYYGTIVSKIKEHAPNAKIILLSIPRFDERHMDSHIEEIAELFEVPFIDLTEDEFFTSFLFSNLMVKDHPVAFGYSGMARAIERLTQSHIIEYPSYWADFGMI